MEEISFSIGTTSLQFFSQDAQDLRHSRLWNIFPWRNKIRQSKLNILFFGKDPRIAIGRSCCIKMWLSWLFKPIILHWLSWIQREMFEAYPLGTLISGKTLKKLSFSLGVIVKQAGGKYDLSFLVFCRWSSRLIPISSKSRRAF